MKILKAKRRERILYSIHFNFESNTYKKEYSLMKLATVSIFGLIPLYSTKSVHLNVPVVL